MNKLIPQIKETSYTVAIITSNTVDRLKEFYHNSETTFCKFKLWYSAAITRLQPNVAGLLCYLIGWVSGAFMLLIKRGDSFVRFHAWQSIVTFGILTVPILVLNLVSTENNILYLVLIILYWIVIAFSVFLWVFLMFKAYRGQPYKLYVVNNIVSKLSGAEGKKVIAGQEVQLALETGGDMALMPGVVEAPKLEGRIEREVDSLRGVLNEAVRSIVILCETRDPYTASHQQKVSKLACAIAREMGLAEDQIEGIRIMGIIHDIGKVAVPSEILSKPGKLSSHEFGIIKTHSQAAYDILKGLVFPWPVAQAILQHHERLNGSGYPNALSGESIIIEARILGVSDVVEAMASHRPYRPALGINKALSEISQNKGILYDGSVVEACLRLFAEKRFKLEE